MRESRLFHLRGYKGSVKNFQGAIVITSAPLDYRFVQGAWNYAIRKTAPGFDVVNYNAALDWLREHHTDWIVSEEDAVLRVDFARGHNQIEHYTPPED